MKGEDVESVPNSNDASSLLAKDDVLTLGSEEDGIYDLDLTSEQQKFCEYFGERQGEEQTEHKEKQAPRGSPGEAPIIEEAMEGEKEDGESHGVR